MASLQKEMTALASRESQAQSRTPYNIGLLGEEVSSITIRWDNACRQVSERYSKKLRNILSLLWNHLYFLCQYMWIIKILLVCLDVFLWVTGLLQYNVRQFLTLPCVCGDVNVWVGITFDIHELWSPKTDSTVVHRKLEDHDYNIDEKFEYCLILYFHIQIPSNNTVNSVELLCDMQCCV